MSNLKYKLLPLGFLYFIALASLGSSSNAATKLEPHAPPFTLPFDTKKIGQTYTFDVKIAEPLVYAVRLRFYINKPSKYSHFLDSYSLEDDKRLRTILGGAVLADSGTWIEPGVPAKFLVQINTSADNKPLLSELIDHPKIASMHMGRYTDLVQKKLSAGIYTIRVGYLQGDPELGTLQAEILFARAHHGK